jgi:hypothetical protein
MTHSPSTTSLGLAYNAFLYATIHDEAGATPLSTVSALARLDIDPWEEAAELARLPRESATERLAGLLARLPGGQSGFADTETTAIRLVGLLPGRTGETWVLPERTPGAAAAFKLTLVATALVMTVIVLLTSLIDASTDRTRGETSVNATATSGSSVGGTDLLAK